MNKLIGEKLEKAITILNEQGIAYTIVDNNFSVNGDTKIVTNITAKDKSVVLTVGNFIFDVRNKNNEKQ